MNRYFHLLICISFLFIVDLNESGWDHERWNTDEKCIYLHKIWCSVSILRFCCCWFDAKVNILSIYTIYIMEMKCIIIHKFMTLCFARNTTVVWGNWQETPMFSWYFFQNFAEHTKMDCNEIHGIDWKHAVCRFGFGHLSFSRVYIQGSSYSMCMFQFHCCFSIEFGSK